FPCHASARCCEDGSGPAHSGLEIERRVFALGNRRKFAPVLGEQCFVGGPPRFAGPHSRLDRAFGWLASPANQLNEYVDASFAGEQYRIGEPTHLLEIDTAIFRA